MKIKPNAPVRKYTYHPPTTHYTRVYKMDAQQLEELTGVRYVEQPELMRYMRPFQIARLPGKKFRYGLSHAGEYHLQMVDVVAHTGWRILDTYQDQHMIAIVVREVEYGFAYKGRGSR